MEPIGAALVRDSLAQHLHSHLRHLPSPHFQSIPDCEVFLASLADRGIRAYFLLSEVHGTRAMIKALLGAGLEPKDLGVTDQATLDRFINPNLENQLEELMLNVRPQLMKLAAGELGLTPWIGYQTPRVDVSDEAAHYLAQLGLPEVKGSGKVSGTPSLLLHDLGSTSDNPPARDLFAFSDPTHRFFINASGSGKTRLCLEAMCLKYSLYFTCSDPVGKACNTVADVLNVPDIGSSDLSNVFKTLSDSLIPHSEQNLDAQVYRSNSDLRHNIGRRNSANAQFLLLRVFAARLYLLDQYLRCAATIASQSSTSLDHLQYKRAWMYLQVQPHILDVPDVDDIFTHFVNCFHTTSDRSLTDLCYRNCKSIRTFLGLGLDVRLPVVIDEAQEGLQQLPSAFLSSEPDTETREYVARPLLREVTAHWSEFASLSNICDINMVIAGTGLSLSQLKWHLRSSLAKTEIWRNSLIIGSFDARNEQYAYVAAYLPSSLLQSDHGKILCERLWYWLRGRHRFTAAFIQYLLHCLTFDGFKANVLLNMFIYVLGGFYPLDAMSQGYPLRLENVPEPSLTTIHFEKLAPGCVISLREAVFWYMIRGEPPQAFDKYIESLLEVGLGKLIGVSPTRHVMQIHEPLILTGAFTWFNQSASILSDESPLALPLFSFLSKNVGNNSSKYNGFECFLAYYFSQVFSQSSTFTLSEIFKFPRPVLDNGTSPLTAVEIDLGSYRGTLVSFFYMSDTGTLLEGSFDYPPFPRTGETPGYAGPIGISAQDTSPSFTSLEVLNHRTASPASILFPGKLMGPDLVFMLRLDKPRCDPKYLWVTVQAKLTQDHIYGQRKINAIGSVTPEKFYSTKTRAHETNAQSRGDAEPHDIVDGVDEAHELLSNTTKVNASRGAKGEDCNMNAKKSKENVRRNQILGALKEGRRGLPSPDAGAYGLLRVLAVFPHEVHPTDIFDGDSENHPLVSLDCERMQEVTENTVPKGFVALLKEQMIPPTKKRNRSANGTGEGGEDTQEISAKKLKLGE